MSFFKLLYGIFFLFLFCIISHNSYAQERTIEEFRLRVYNMDRPLRWNDIITIEKVSTVWQYNEDTTAWNPIDTFPLAYGYSLGEYSGIYYGGEFKLRAHRWLSGEYRYPDSWINNGLYKIIVGEEAQPESDSNGYPTWRWEFVQRDSIYLDLTDHNWPWNGLSYADFFIDYNWSNKMFTLVSPVVPDTSWYYDDPIAIINPWQYHWVKPNTPSSRACSLFVPAPPKDFVLGASSGNPHLSWTTNGETFPVKYFIYRRLDNKYGGTYTLYDSTTGTSYIDYDLAGAGSTGAYLAYYFVKTKNNSAGSEKISSSTDTLEIHWRYWGYGKNSALAENKRFILHPNYPNPFNPSTEISYQLPSDEYVSLKIYNALGQEVRSLVSGTQSAGTHKIIWDGKNRYGQSVPSGVYLYRLQTASFTKTMKMIMLR